MCKLENKALVAAFDYLNKNGVEVSALVFDGLMVYKDTVKDINEVHSLQKPKDKVWILEVDLEYPKELHKLHNDYPLAPDKNSSGKWMAFRVSNRTVRK